VVKPLTTYDAVATEFVAALGKDNDEDALRLFRECSLQSTDAPIPRAKVYFDSGEWDTNDKLPIKLIVDSSCFGRIDSTSPSPLGVERFCRCASCSIELHQKAQVLIQLDYWYIQAGPTSLIGFFAAPWLLSSCLGGPVSSLFEARTNYLGRPAFGGMHFM
jgi:hypothetical protein